MTRQEAKDLESDIANDVLNNFPLSGLVMLATDASKSRAKQIMDENSEEDLIDMKGKYAEAKAKAEAQKMESGQLKTPIAPTDTTEGTSGTSGG